MLYFVNVQCHQSVAGREHNHQIIRPHGTTALHLIYFYIAKYVQYLVSNNWPHMTFTRKLGSLKLPLHCFQCLNTLILLSWWTIYSYKIHLKFSLIFNIHLPVSSYSYSCCCIYGIFYEPLIARNEKESLIIIFKSLLNNINQFFPELIRNRSILTTTGCLMNSPDIECYTYNWNENFISLNFRNRTNSWKVKIFK